MDNFVNRDNELKAFDEALIQLSNNSPTSQILLFHGVTGMGKTYLLKECQRKTESSNQSAKPFTIYVDCNRVDMTLEVLFNEIHLNLADQFKKDFDEYSGFLEKIDKLEMEVDAEAASNTENAQKITNIISSVASKAITSSVPGAAALGEGNVVESSIKTALAVAGEGITSLRRKFAQRKLDADKYRLFLKDLQSEQAKRLAQILNNIAKSKKIVLFVDRFEKLAKTPNTRSDKTFYEYWRNDFLNNLSQNILLVQAGRVDYEDDYQLYLGDKTVDTFELKPFTEDHISKIFSSIELLQQHMSDFIKFLFTKTQGYPVAVGLIKGHIKNVATIEEIERIKDKILIKEQNIIKQSISWFLDKNMDPEYSDKVYKLAVCSSRSGQIDKEAIKYIYRNDKMTFPQIEAAFQNLSQQYGFIDSINWTIHELVREFILRHLNNNAKDYIKNINEELRAFYKD